jgi:hypothetical protein
MGKNTGYKEGKGIITMNNLTGPRDIKWSSITGEWIIHYWVE